MTNYRYIADITKSELQKEVVIPCLNEQGFRSIIIKNSTTKRHSSIYTTKYLVIKKNTVLYHNNDEYFCHIISCKDSSLTLNNNFQVIYNYLFKKIEAEIDEHHFSELLQSIEELFSKASESIENIQIGFAGELLTLIHLYQNGITDIFTKYHKSNFSKHDIEINEYIKIEVKTTVKEKRIHRFSHSQLNNESFSIYLSSVLLAIEEKGMTLYSLFNRILSIIDDFETSFTLHKMMNYAGVDSITQGISFSFENSLKRIKILSIQSIPKLTCDIPNGVTNINYDVQCDFGIEIDINEIKSFF